MLDGREACGTGQSTAFFCPFRSIGARTEGLLPGAANLCIAFALARMEQSWFPDRKTAPHGCGTWLRGSASAARAHDFKTNVALSTDKRLAVSLYDICQIHVVPFGSDLGPTRVLGVEANFSRSPVICTCIGHAHASRTAIHALLRRRCFSVALSFVTHAMDKFPPTFIRIGPDFARFMDCPGLAMQAASDRHRPFSRSTSMLGLWT